MVQVEFKNSVCQIYKMNIYILSIVTLEHFKLHITSLRRNCYALLELGHKLEGKETALKFPSVNFSFFMTSLKRPLQSATRAEKMHSISPKVLTRSSLLILIN